MLKLKPMLCDGLFHFASQFYIVMIDVMFQSSLRKKRKPLLSRIFHYLPCSKSKVSSEAENFHICKGKELPPNS
ncbi:hypothetical protein T12_11873 [Trichinella patagoniensis]|uniref:Uncharacterized protein n=1 Tax=Trichinella patagoniensis TaxID=990121 RepID=A0A0V0ZVX3_9BILA|nr:hypothetical protein T12_11873 [Trichinella patagoniensis]